MAATLPFQANTGASSTGVTVGVAAVSTSPAAPGTLDCTGGMAPSILITNTAAAGVTLFVRIDRETTPVATSLDMPILGQSSRVIANPNPNGKCGIAVSGSVGTLGGAGTVFFTPGQGGI